MILRAFAESDRSAVIDLWHEVGLTRPWNDPSKDIDRATATWPDLFLVACDGGDGQTGDDGVVGSVVGSVVGAVVGAVVGTALAGYDGHRGWIYYLAVAPSHQGRGIGRALIAEAEARLMSLGCPKAMLMVRRGNEEAYGFYGGSGYSEDDVVTFGKRLIPD